MDWKLARGLAREGFRLAMKHDDLSRMTEVIDSFHDSFQRSKKISKKQARNGFERIAAEAARSKTIVHVENFVDARTRGLSPSFRAKCVFSRLQHFDDGADPTDPILRYNLYLADVNRSRFEFLELSYPCMIRQHAVRRYLERTSSTFSAITTGLWPGILVIEAINLSDTSGSFVPFLLPVPQGAFLGVRLSQANRFRGRVEGARYDCNGMTAIDYEVASTKFLSNWAISTFIAFEQMTDDQIILHKRLTNLIKTHEQLLMLRHWDGLLIAERSKAENFHFPGTLSVDLEGASKQFDDLFRKAKSDRTIRDPSDTVFSNELATQQFVDKHGLEHALATSGIDAGAIKEMAFALQRGETEAEIRRLLEKATGKELPL